MKSAAIVCENSATLTGRWYSSDPHCTFAPWLLAAVFATSFFLTQLNSARALADDPVATIDQTNIEFFEKQIRPLLVERCQQCHGEKRQWAGLRLDSRDAIIAEVTKQLFEGSIANNARVAKAFEIAPESANNRCTRKRSARDHCITSVEQDTLFDNSAAIVQQLMLRHSRNFQHAFFIHRS